MTDPGIARWAWVGPTLCRGQMLLGRTLKDGSDELEAGP